MMHAMPFEPAEKPSDGTFELVDCEIHESMGLFASAKDAAEFAATMHLKCFHVYDAEGVLVMER